MLANSRPVVSVSSTTMNVTIGEEITLNIDVTDSDVDDTTTLYLEFENSTDESDVSSIASLVGNVFTWTPATIDSVELG